MFRAPGQYTVNSCPKFHCSNYMVHMSSHPDAPIYALSAHTLQRLHTCPLEVSENELDIAQKKLLCYKMGNL